MLTHIGYNNYAASARIITAVSPTSAPVKRIIAGARDRGMLVDVTEGRRTRAVLVMDSGHVVLSAKEPGTVAGRVKEKERQDALVSLRE